MRTAVHFILFVLIPPVASVGAFTFPRTPNEPAFPCPATPPRGVIRSRTTTSLASSLAEPEGGAVEPAASTPSVELWLDLRGTAILPQAAVAHLTDDLSGDDETRGRIVDRVLISEEGVARALRHTDDENDPSHDLQPGTFYMYVKDDDDTVRNVRDDGTVMGKVVSLGSDALSDPIPALDAVSRGGWVVIDSEAIEGQDERGEAVAGLVEFLSAGTSVASSSSLILGGDGESDAHLAALGDGIADATHAGGIALSCKTNTDVLRSGATIHAIGSGSFVSAADSGILLHGEQDAEPPPFRAAIILPFDALLWRAASFVLSA